MNLLFSRIFHVQTKLTFSTWAYKWKLKQQHWPYLVKSTVLCLSNCANQICTISEILNWRMFHAIFQYFWIWSISRIIRAWLYEGIKDSDWEPNVHLVQSGRHQLQSLLAMGSLHTCGFLPTFFFRLSNANSDIKCKVLTWKSRIHWWHDSLNS